MNPEMTHKQRILSAIARKSVGKHPVQVDFSPAGLDKIFKHLNMTQLSEEDLVEFLDNHIVYAFLNDPFGKIRKRQTGGQKVLFDEWGTGWDTTQEGTFFCYHPLENMDNYKSYKFPDPYSPKLMDFAKETTEKYNNEYLVSSYQVVCLFERAWALRGFENFMMDIMINVDFAETLLDKITEYQMMVAKRYIEAGVTCGRTGDDYGAQTGMLMSPSVWRNMLKPRLKRIWDVYKQAGLPVIHHSCGDVRPIIPDFIEMGLDVLNNVQSEAMPIEELSMKYGKDLTFYGGISTQKVLPFGTPDDVRNEVKKCIDVLGKNKGYIISPSIAITSDVPIENINALLEAIKEYNVID